MTAHAQCLRIELVQTIGHGIAPDLAHCQSSILLGNHGLNTRLTQDDNEEYADFEHLYWDSLHESVAMD